MRLEAETKRHLVVRYYQEASENANREAAEAFLDGFYYALRLQGTDEDYLAKLEEELKDLLDSYIEGEWEDE